MDKMSPEYKSVSKQILEILKQSELSEFDKYSILAACITNVAHEYNNNNFSVIKAKVALTCKTMLDAIDAAERIFGKILKK